MNEELIKEIFVTIAFRAIECSKDLRLERGKTTSTSNVLGGAFQNSSHDIDSLSLFVYDSSDQDDVTNMVTAEEGET